jgi:nucleoside phosphorylase
LLTFAVEPEFAGLRKLLDFQASQNGEHTLYRVQVGQATVDVILTGMGPANATRAVNATLTTSAPYTVCICSGFCGGLKAEAGVGDILVARAVRDARSGETFECASDLVSRARSDGARPVELISSEEIAATAEEKARLAPLADAVDMESYAVLSSAARRNVPGVAIRVVSDRFDQDLPLDFSEAVDAAGNVRIGGVMKQVARHPNQIPALIRMGRESKAAGQGLANFLEAYITKISVVAREGIPAAAANTAAH